MPSARHHEPRCINVRIAILLSHTVSRFDHVFGQAEQVGAVQDPRHRVDGLQRLDLGFRCRAELLELARRHEHARFVRADGVVERLDRAVQSHAQRVQILGHLRHARVQLLAERLDLLGVLRQPLVPPALRDHLQQRDQRDRAGRKHARAHAEVDELDDPAASADWKNASPGRNITTNSGDGCTCSQ